MSLNKGIGFVLNLMIKKKNIFPFSVSKYFLSAFDTFLSEFSVQCNCRLRKGERLYWQQNVTSKWKTQG